MRTSIHCTDIQRRCIGIPWQYEKIQPNDRLRISDVAYLVKNHGEIYSWGYISKIEPYKDQGLERDALRVSVNRPVLADEIIPVRELRQSPILERIFANSQDNLIELIPEEAKVFNQLLRAKGVDAPADPTEEVIQVIEIPRPQTPEQERIFTINQPVDFEETRNAEFKEIKGGNPVDAIKNAVDEYAVAFLNTQPGRILWGIRNDDRVVAGVRLDDAKRDRIRREVSNKLAQIQPYFPQLLIDLKFHAVRDENGQAVDGLWIFEVSVPKGLPTELYATGGNAVFVKTEGGKQALNHLQIVAEIEQRRILKQIQARDAEEDLMFAMAAELTKRVCENKTAWIPAIGSDEHKMAEKMVARNMLVRVTPGTYTLPGIINPAGFGGRRF